MLSDRIASASDEQTWDLLEEAWDFINTHHDGGVVTIAPGHNFECFERALAGQFYHDAAMMLIKPGWMITYLSELGLAGGCVCELGNPGTSQSVMSDEGARSIPLAIAAAAVKVKECE